MYESKQTRSCDFSWVVTSLLSIWLQPEVSFLKDYSNDVILCAQLLHEFLIAGCFDVRFGQSDTEDMLRTIATS